MTRRRLIALACLVAAAGCGGSSGDPPPAGGAAPTGSASALRFVDGTAASGLDAFLQVNGTPEKPLLIESIGGGVALFDHDGDGDLDAYLTNGSRVGGFPPGEEPRDALFANDGHARFSDVTAAVGLGDTLWSFGVTAADHDGDGDTDLYVTNDGPNALYRNAGGTFAAVAEGGAPDPLWSTGACFLDHDRDGDLDLYVANYVLFDPEYVRARALKETFHGIAVNFGPRGLPAAEDSFFENDGRGAFTDASERAGIRGDARFGFQALAFDFDADGRMDVYVANDSQPNFLWRNRGDGSFQDTAVRHGLAFSMDGGAQSGMGVGLGDFDDDLIPDLFVTNFSEDYFTLYRGLPGGNYQDVTTRAKLRIPTLPMLGWGCGFEDFDADGDQDLYAINGHVYPQVDRLALGTSYRQRNQLFENVDGVVFREPDGGGGPGFALEQASRGGAVGDVDGDGDLDLLIGNIDGPPALLLNESPGAGHGVRVRLVGAGKNREAIGARAVASAGGRRAARWVAGRGGFLSTSEPELFFGLGRQAALDELEVTWPGGAVERFEHVAAGRVVVVEGRGLERP